MSSKPRRLLRTFKEKVWGSKNLSPWYREPDDRIGEVWFEASLPLLVKFIFTSERLSVQVHPGDDFAARHENSLGKTEMWHILRADPGAQIALGFRTEITTDVLKESALSGEILELLNWIDVHPGDTFFAPAGTVHAIGAGIALCEIQQHSDVTYRIFDYGRPRELHLDRALEVCDTSAFDARPVGLPIACTYFQTDELRIDSALLYQPEARPFEVLVIHQGEGRIAGEPYRPGEAWLLPEDIQSFEIAPRTSTRLLRTWLPKL